MKIKNVSMLFSFVFAFAILLVVAKACINPTIYNEYHVPIGYYGTGYLTINVTSVPDRFYNYTIYVKNNCNEKVYVYLEPEDSLNGYVYGRMVVLEPYQEVETSIYVYTEGVTQFGSLKFYGYCNETGSFATGEIRVLLVGKGTSTPSKCLNTIHSCGVYPNCRDISSYSGCYEGKKKEYFCGGNEVFYTEKCDSSCCQEYYGEGSYCYHGRCVTSNGCVNSCSFSGTKCIDGSVYSCVEGDDGCNHLVLVEDCDALCYDGRCIDEEDETIAFLCKDDSCSLESDLINFFEQQGYVVVGKKYDSWSEEELENFDVMVCRDEYKACKVRYDSNIYKAHRQGVPLVEIPAYSTAYAMYRLGYGRTPYTYTSTLSMAKANEDWITQPFGSKVLVFNPGRVVSWIYGSYVSDEAKPVVYVRRSNQVVLLKVPQSLDHGRYAFVGLLSTANVEQLTQEGKDLLERTIRWAIYGFGDNETQINHPPVAMFDVTPEQGYANETVFTFDASRSYDPDNDELSYFWDFGDGYTASGKIIHHVFQRPGEYHTVLVVSDGYFNSTNETVVKVVMKPTRRVALACDSCNSEQVVDLEEFLVENGVEVVKKPMGSWRRQELRDFPLVICRSYSCNLFRGGSLYKAHKYDKVPFLEVPYSTVAKAAYVFGYVSWYDAQKTRTKTFEVSTNFLNLTEGSYLTLYNSNQLSSVIQDSRVNEGYSVLEDEKGSCLLVVNESTYHGRYAFVGWLYSSTTDELSEESKKLLLGIVDWLIKG